MKKNHTLLELLLGIILLGVITQIICVIVSKNYLYDAVGLWSGVALSGFLAIHMAYSIEEIVDVGEKHAVKRARGAYAVRVLIAVLVAGCVIYFKLGNYVTLLISAFFLKISAYMQPFTHKAVQKIRTNRKGG